MGVRTLEHGGSLSLSHRRAGSDQLTWGVGCSFHSLSPSLSHRSAGLDPVLFRIGTCAPSISTNFSFCLLTDGDIVRSTNGLGFAGAPTVSVDEAPTPDIGRADCGQPRYSVADHLSVREVSQEAHIYE